VATLLTIRSNSVFRNSVMVCLWKLDWVVTDNVYVYWFWSFAFSLAKMPRIMIKGGVWRNTEVQRGSRYSLTSTLILYWPRASTAVSTLGPRTFRTKTVQVPKYARHFATSLVTSCPGHFGPLEKWDQSDQGPKWQIDLKDLCALTT